MTVVDRPVILVQIARGTGYVDAAGSPTWTDITAYVENPESIGIVRGRPDERSFCDPNKLTITLNNRDGRFTPGKTGGAYYPDIKKGLPIRVSAQWPSSGGTVYQRFFGFVDDWPVEWPGGVSNWSSVTITASSPQARMGRGTIRSMLSEEILLDNNLYWPLTDESGSLEAGTLSPTPGVPTLGIGQVGVGGELEFGGGVGLGTSDAPSIVKFTRASATAGKFLVGRGLEAFLDPTKTHIHLECVVRSPGADYPSGYLQTAVSLQQYGNASNYLRLYMTAGGYWRAEYSQLDRSTGTVTEVHAATAFPQEELDDMTPHYLAAKIDSTGTAGSPALYLYYDDEVVGPVTATTEVIGGTETWCRFDALYVGGQGSASSLFNGDIGAVSIYQGSSALAASHITGHRDIALNRAPYALESCVSRCSRLAGYAGWAKANSAPGGEMEVGPQNTDGRSAVDAMQEIATTDMGVLYDADDGTSTYDHRGLRYTRTSATLTLDAQVQDVETDLQANLDDQFLVNDVTASSAAGYVGTKRIIDQTSIDTYGPYPISLTFALASPELNLGYSNPEDGAAWLVDAYAEPTVRIDRVGIELLGRTSDQITAILAVKIGHRIQITNLPSQAPATTMDFFVEGGTETINARSHLITFNLSPAEIYDGWVLGTSTLNQTARVLY